jgi:hypothetical protein
VGFGGEEGVVFVFILSVVVGLPWNLLFGLVRMRKPKRGLESGRKAVGEVQAGNQVAGGAFSWFQD